jgi:hypothetical protein
LSNGIWSVVPSPNPSEKDDIVCGVAAISDSDVWAVAAYHLGAGRPFDFDEAHRSAADMAGSLQDLRERRAAAIYYNWEGKQGFEYPSIFRCGALTETGKLALSPM